MIAYRLRFDDEQARSFLAAASRGLVVLVAAHFLTTTGIGLYRALRLWPVRLAAGTIVGVLLGVGLTAVATSLEGVSRRAMVVYAVLFVIGGMAWRAAVALQARRLQRRIEVAAEPGLEVRGAQYQSLGGGVLLSWRYRHLLRNLVVRDLKLKYRGSVLGFLWSLLNPLVMIAVYNFAFTYVMGVRTERYVSFVMIGILSWGFFAGATTGSTTSIMASGALLYSVLFPP